MKYDILTADVDDYLKLRSSVRRFIKKGWEPLGGVAAYKGDAVDPSFDPGVQIIKPGRIFQAIIKKEVDVNPNTYVLNMKISECFRLKVPRYLIRRLESEGIEYIHELIEKTELDLLGMKFMGRRKLDYLIKALNSMGLQFKMGND